MIPDSVDLVEGELSLVGRVTVASNQTYVGTIGTVEVVYKPLAGEKPLWDFPDGRLAFREVAAGLVSEATGWNIVPRTWFRDGPYGEGMVQLWVPPVEGPEAVQIVDAGAIPPGFRHVVDGVGYGDRPVSLVHEDSSALRRMAIFDAVINNADRKGGHILEQADGHRFGIDHGICFHSEPKLRTVLWGWAGTPLLAEEADVLRRLRAVLETDLGDELGYWLRDRDLEALAERVDRLIETERLPHPEPGWPAIPWPPF